MKNIYIIKFFLTILVIPITVLGQPVWFEKMKKIKLLKSTYKSVVELYGESKNPNGYILREFDTPDGTLSVILSIGKCGTKYKKGFDVEADVIERISFYVNKKNRVKVNKLGLDLSKFRKTKISDVPGTYYYENLDAGIHISTDEKGLVEDIDFQPSSEFEGLYCR